MGSLFLFCICLSYTLKDTEYQKENLPREAAQLAASHLGGRWILLLLSERHTQVLNGDLVKVGLNPTNCNDH